jgi:hypothetical protein
MFFIKIFGCKVGLAYFFPGNAKPTFTEPERPYTVIYPEQISDNTVTLFANEH